MSLSICVSAFAGLLVLMRNLVPSCRQKARLSSAYVEPPDGQVLTDLELRMSWTETVRIGDGGIARDRTGRRSNFIHEHSLNGGRVSYYNRRRNIILQNIPVARIRFGDSTPRFDEC